MAPIHNMRVYTDGMRKSMMDKLWFLDKLDDSVDAVYDYGCADGALLSMVGEILPDMKLMGYDISQEMIDKAKANVPGAERLSTAPERNLTNTVLNASSVFHEIHAYSQDVAADYRNIFESGASFIAIRDMFYTNHSCHPTDPVSLARVLQHEPHEKVAEFEAYNGTLDDNKNFLHYLLTYRYIENWEREVQENYFPHSIETFLGKLPGTYEIVFFEHYTLPFLRDRIHNDFGFTLTDPTHAKILLKRAGQDAG